MLIYLSGPMRGLPEFNYPAFNAAAAHLRAQGYAVLDPAETAGGEIGLPRGAYLGLDIAYVQAADAVAVLPGWRASEGALLEVHLAHVLGKPIYAYHGERGLGSQLSLTYWDVGQAEKTWPEWG